MIVIGWIAVVLGVAMAFGCAFAWLDRKWTEQDRNTPMLPRKRAAWSGLPEGYRRTCPGRVSAQHKPVLRWKREA